MALWDIVLWGMGLRCGPGNALCEVVVRAMALRLLQSRIFALVYMIIGGVHQVSLASFLAGAHGKKKTPDDDNICAVRRARCPSTMCVHVPQSITFLNYYLLIRLCVPKIHLFTYLISDTEID